MGNSLLIIIVGIVILYLLYNGKLDIILDVLMNPKKYEAVNTVTK